MSLLLGLDPQTKEAASLPEEALLRHAVILGAGPG
jgi:hypothetical protein